MHAANLFLASCFFNLDLLLNLNYLESGLDYYFYYITYLDLGLESEDF